MKKEESTVLCPIERFSEMLPSNSAFETLPVQIVEPVVERTTEITNELCYPSSSSSSSSTGKKEVVQNSLVTSSC